MSNALADTESMEGMLSTQVLIVFFVCLPAIAVISYACYICSSLQSAVSRWEKAHRDSLPSATASGRASLRTNGPWTRRKTRELQEFIDGDAHEIDK